MILFQNLLVVAVIASSLNVANEFSVPQDDESVANGIYVINRWTETRRDLEPKLDGEILLEHDPKNLEADSDEPVIYVTIHPDKAVLFEEVESIDPVDQADGRINLGLTLSEKSTEKLEKLTREHLGRQVAVVVGNKVITTHKIRSVIKDGKVQIMRCTDDGCKVILQELKSNK